MYLSELKKFIDYLAELRLNLPYSTLKIVNAYFIEVQNNKIEA